MLVQHQQPCNISTDYMNTRRHNIDHSSWCSKHQNSELSRNSNHQSSVSYCQQPGRLNHAGKLQTKHPTTEKKKQVLHSYIVFQFITNLERELPWYILCKSTHKHLSHDLSLSTRFKTRNHLTTTSTVSLQS